jgi:hypothetical protein
VGVTVTREQQLDDLVVRLRILATTLAELDKRLDGVEAAYGAPPVDASRTGSG